MKKLTTLATCILTTTTNVWADQPTASTPEIIGEFQTTGQISECIDARRIRGVAMLDELNVLIIMARNKRYISKLTQACRIKDLELTSVGVNFRGARLCTNDRFHVTKTSRIGTMKPALSQNRSSACYMGDFEELTKITKTNSIHNEHKTNAE